MLRKTILNLSKLKKINPDKIQIPTSINIDLLTQYKYNASQLKCFLKHYKLKMSGNKEELLNRLYYYLSLSKIITKLQKIFRGHIQRSYNYYQGPAALDRSICVNDTDFLTMDELKDIPIGDINVSIPEKYESVLQFLYGTDWKIPKQNYNWVADSISTIVSKK